MKKYGVIILIVVLVGAGALWALDARQVKAPTETSPATVEAGINETISALDVSVTPLEVLEDSRCPEEVTCVWEGRVRLLVRLGSSEQELILGEPLTIETKKITLTKVSPAPKAETEIGTNEYRFSFEITN